MNTISKIGADRPCSIKLDLSGQSISVKEMTAIAHALNKDVIFTKLIFADAFIGDDGKDYALILEDVLFWLMRSRLILPPCSWTCEGILYDQRER